MLLLSQEIIERFGQCIEAAGTAGEIEPTAMVLATSDGKGLLSTRTVLLKGFDEHGFVFYTNTHSSKGQQLRSFPRAAATFLWKSTQTQVQLAGAVEPVTAKEADAYFSSRDRGSQVGAWASLQSQELDRRETLDQRVREFEEKFAGQPVPRPPYWSGFRIKPVTVEFWQGREFRLHDRIQFRIEGGQWLCRRLYP